MVNRMGNSLSINGKAGVMVMINGKRVYMEISAVIQMLSSMPSGDIERFEIITTPQANFDSPDITSFSASPDGKLLGMIMIYQQQKGRPSALKVLDLQSKKIHELFKTPWGDATKFLGLGWSHDATYTLCSK